MALYTVRRLRPICRFSRRPCILSNLFGVPLEAIALCRLQGHQVLADTKRSRTGSRSAFRSRTHGRIARCVSSPLAGDEQGGGARCPARRESGGIFDNLLGPRDPPPPPAPTRGGGGANAVDSN